MAAISDPNSWSGPMPTAGEPVFDPGGADVGEVRDQGQGSVIVVQVGRGVGQVEVTDRAREGAGAGAPYDASAAAAEVVPPTPPRLHAFRCSRRASAEHPTEGVCRVDGQPARIQGSRTDAFMVRDRPPCARSYRNLAGDQPQAALIRPHEGRERRCARHRRPEPPRPGGRCTFADSRYRPSPSWCHQQTGGEYSLQVRAMRAGYPASHRPACAHSWTGAGAGTAPERT